MLEMGPFFFGKKKRLLDQVKQSLPPLCWSMVIYRTRPVLTTETNQKKYKACMWTNPDSAYLPSCERYLPNCHPGLNKFSEMHINMSNANFNICIWHPATYIKAFLSIQQVIPSYIYPFHSIRCLIPNHF